jgi:MoxR-like ATPase
METLTQDKLSYFPEKPLTAELLGIPWSLMVDLVARRLHYDGQSSLYMLQESLKMPLPVVDSVFRFFQKEKLAEIKGLSGQDFQVALTGAGRQFALERMRACHYAGPAPVPLFAYHQVVNAQAARPTVSRERLKRAMDDLVVTDDILDKLGPALVSQKSLFLFGSTGNGKTSLAERLARVYDDLIVIPHAIEVDNQVISVYDPVVHERVTIDAPMLDERWVVCRRPEVMVGGELTHEMLELRLDSTTNIYTAPVQVKANNGVLVIDDFGRQVMTPAEMLNRWIVPLDRKVDYLNLSYGLKFQVPFQVMIAFSTNLEPTKLLDRAFLRRVPNKIYVPPVSEETFWDILKREADKRRLQVDMSICEHMIMRCREKAGHWLRACYPRDLLDIIVAIDEYEERKPCLSNDQVDRAAGIYFSETFEHPEIASMS